MTLSKWAFLQDSQIGNGEQNLWITSFQAFLFQNRSLVSYWHLKYLKWTTVTGSRTKVGTFDSTTRTNHFHPGPIFLLSLFSVLGSLETSASSCHVPEVINAQIGRNGRFRWNAPFCPFIFCSWWEIAMTFDILNWREESTRLNLHHKNIFGGYPRKVG